MTFLNPEFLKTKQVPALRDRVILSHMGVQQGVFEDDDFAVYPTTGMGIEVRAGNAMVPANQTGNRGLYHVESTAAEPLTFTTSPTNPRLDQVILRVKDPSFDTTLVTSTPTVEILPGTATAGATINNRSGAAALPAGCLRLADVIIGTATSTITDAIIRDRRPWARGFARQVLYTGGDNASVGGSNALPTNTGFNAATKIQGEFTGVPIEIHFGGGQFVANNVAQIRVGVGATLSDGVTFSNLGARDEGGWSSNSTNTQGFDWKSVQTIPAPGGVGYLEFFPLAGIMEATVVGWTGTVRGIAGVPLIFSVRELLIPGDWVPGSV